MSGRTGVSLHFHVAHAAAAEGRVIAAFRAGVFHLGDAPFTARYGGGHDSPAATRTFMFSLRGEPGEKSLFLVHCLQEHGLAF